MDPRGISPNDLREIEGFKAHHPIGRLLTEIRDVWRFSVGDVLIRHRMNGDHNDIDPVSDVCPIPKKFKVIHIDDLGIPWIKQLSVRGGLGTKLISLVEAWNNGKYRYIVDPEQVDAILLGYKYDPRLEYKRLRNENPNYGKTKTK
jgi:hypothetical protein